MIEQMFPSDAQVLIQGITGKEGTRMASWLIGCGVNVVGGVTPGKAGQAVEGRPVFGSVADARKAFPDCAVTSIVVPPSRVLGAVTDALVAGFRFVHILTEQVPVHDVIAIRRLAAGHEATVLGPSSIGYLQYPKFRIGYLGGEKPFESVLEGATAVISTSGGMTNELMAALSRNGVGTRFAIAIGGDRVVGTTLEDVIAFAERQDDVKLIVLFVEPGRPLLRELLSGARTFTKPAVVYLAGDALDDLPRGVPYGHTGTVLGEDDVSVRESRESLHARGISCVGTMSEFITACKTYA
jgi:succinyl-CoA synthetase alpha subunit